MTATNVVLREATAEDVPALLSLLLTSFRRFPLFDILYWPLHTDKENALDTIYFWGRRLQKALWNASATIIVAEILASDAIPDKPGTLVNQLDEDSWDMFNWISSKPEFSQHNPVTGKTIVAFALWRWEGMPTPTENPSRLPLFVKAQETLVDLQLWFFGRFYSRKDQNIALYKEYLRSEDKMSKRYHLGPFLLLDNLCVDFRVMRLGIGRKLLEWGIQQATENSVPIKTETTDNNLPFYKKVGFEKTGEWIVHAPSPSDEMILPVLEWKLR